MLGFNRFCCCSMVSDSRGATQPVGMLTAQQEHGRTAEVV